MIPIITNGIVGLNNEGGESIMRIIDAMDKLIRTGEDQFLNARDAKQAESMRVMAFNVRRKVPEKLRDDVGIQKYEEGGRWFLKLYKREIGEAELWVRGEDGKLAPAVSTEDSPEIQRMRDLMRKDKKTEEEIAEAIKGM